MALSLLYLAAGAALLYFGGEALVKGAVALALRVGLTPLAVGLTVVAFGTSAPELAVSLDAALQNLGDVALGNVVGSNIGNIGLILGLTALVCPIAVHRQVLRFDLPVLVIVSVLVVLTALDRSLGRVEGVLLTLALLVYLAVVLQLSRRESAVLEAAAEELHTEQSEELPTPAKGGIAIQLVLIVAGVAMLVGGGRVFVTGAVQIAGALHISQAVIALTVVALGTSLPELAACLIAAARGHADIAIGNVVGSNLFNLLCILGITATVRPVTFPEIAMTDLGVMLAMTFLLVPLLWTRRTLSRIEGGVLLAGYLAYVAWLSYSAWAAAQ